MKCAVANIRKYSVEPRERAVRRCSSPSAASVLIVSTLSRHTSRGGCRTTSRAT